MDAAAQGDEDVYDAQHDGLDGVGVGVYLVKNDITPLQIQGHGLVAFDAIDHRRHLMWREHLDRGTHHPLHDTLLDFAIGNLQT